MSPGGPSPCPPALLSCIKMIAKRNVLFLFRSKVAKRNAQFLQCIRFNEV